MSNLDTRIQNADQLLTQDVDRFCDGIVELYSNLSKVWRKLLHGGFLFKSNGKVGRQGGRHSVPAWKAINDSMFSWNKL